MKKLIIVAILLLLVLVGLARLGIIPTGEPTQRRPRTTTQKKQEKKAKKAEKDTRMKAAPSREQGAVLDVMGDM
ncbi:MAG: hypothetical protein HN742_37075 [Lentisphaerae bacterium]|jgi:hypothetical protein|nr:hypothetical protein [Lentisphaerota bacterium]MBT5609016.1 hypothetical protein [Lentisphaerota bacterium]MBT7057452.1 hypothetical protein [Lentisphaerota bacterium]MBT7847540.1 hypothetical protein [Lentisphaerota bacterium]